MRERRWWFLLAFTVFASLLSRPLQWCGPLTRHHGRELVVRHAKDEIAKRLGRVSTPRQRESMESVMEAKDNLAARIVRMEEEVKDLTKRAEAALEADDEAAARAFLEKKLLGSLPLGDSLGKRSGLGSVLRPDALRRVSTVEANVQQLEAQALKVSALLERARDATGAERTALKAEASAFSVKDPLLDRFDRDL
eukprot:Skav201199  [mRNA]  locus=scaffold633:455197:458973:- [translate_table: standard]